MNTLRPWGALAAFAAAGTYLFGFALLATLLAPSGYGMADADPAKVVAFIAANEGLMILWNVSIYVINGFAVALLAVVLADRFKPHAPALAQIGLTFGALWATLVVGAGMIANVGNSAVIVQYGASPSDAVLMWEIFRSIENGLGGGNEIAGGVWALVVGLAMLRTKLLPRALALFSLVIAAAGIATLVPAARDIAGSVFGLGYIVWFVWVGVLFVRVRA